MAPFPIHLVPAWRAQEYFYVFFSEFRSHLWCFFSHTAMSPSRKISPLPSCKKTTKSQLRSYCLMEVKPIQRSPVEWDVWFIHDLSHYLPGFCFTSQTAVLGEILNHPTVSISQAPSQKLKLNHCHVRFPDDSTWKKKVGRNFDTLPNGQRS